MKPTACRALASAAALVLSVCAAHADEKSVGKGMAWTIMEDLTVETGQRLAGSPEEAAAREWAVTRLKALGFQNVKNEPFTIRGYVRGHDSAWLTAPYPHKLAITALGYSGTTPEGGVSGDVVYFPTLDAIKAAPAASLTGKIAFIDHAMKANQDGSGYGPYGNVRRQGPGIAAAKGAIGVVIRSIGTDNHRNPHTGAISWPAGVSAIPAGAVSNPDADIIARVARSGKLMRLSLTLTGRTQENMPSGNVIADLPGRDPSLPMIIVACHLDSWDLGMGVIDDGAGCAIVTAAALKVQEGGKPLRTIRVLWAGAEELGGLGGQAYAKAHAKEPHALAMESDFGADRVWNVKFTRLAPQVAESIKTALNPLGIVPNAGAADGGADVDAIIKAQKLAVIDLAQDGTRYFDLHHTPDDTLDKVDPAQLQQNVDAWTAVLKIVATEGGALIAP
ncbi:M28 family peptidase [Novosphingobium sp. TH158]|uniref:M28 family peptidase n=1 Tax=Novosphingobium sp. TH158 TaxID=2067455 RepID=UPI000C7AF8B2|nr:M28 family peptidase [Novosphingobium sp. TH158]PLK25632.1 peptidase M28 family protein [Novosphingobium sp. TH158]